MLSKYSSKRVTRSEIIAHTAFFLSFIVTITAHDCHRRLETVWQSDVGSSPVVSSALVADFNGDNVRDVLATSLDGQVSVVDGRSGLNLAGWPVTLPGKLLFAAPLLFDYDSDGMNELVLVTADGVVSFVKNDGSFLEGETFKVPPLVMKRDWFLVDPKQISNRDYISSVSNPAKSARLAFISEFIHDNLKGKQQYSNSSIDHGPGDSFWSKYHPGRRPSGLSSDGISVFVDPHILSTPLITDFNGDGTEEELVWEATVSSSSASGIRVADVDGDGFMEAVVATFDGYLWVLEGDSGKVLDGWPVKLPSEVRATVLVTKIVPGESSAADMVVPLVNGQIAIIRGIDRCTELINVGKTVLGSIVSADIVPGRPGLELVLGADDGTLLCLGNAPNAPTDSLAFPVDRNELFSWPAETLPCSGTTFYSGKVGVRFTTKSLENTQITGKYFLIEFEIRDDQPMDVKGKLYKLKIIIGRRLIIKKSYKSPGLYTEQVEVPSKPCRAVVSVQLFTEHGQCFQSSLHASFNGHFKDDMAWLLLVPFITTGCLLLILHGWTQVNADVLPTIMTGKKR
ncbi:protein DEFECTIVE IN EXINE FORMATION 1-like [Pocillopora damicornis]|uniref:protein DEFECTIVE IN EXINE FORMATION 1-like n=1 Tax=Pocillopora damicornis TaxID=46731 RepID=UPI000F556DDE|nr:protein DEFECTIVE IN EXINE FORMATION 1-like [Pocillopora damicornis]